MNEQVRIVEKVGVTDSGGTSIHTSVPDPVRLYPTHQRTVEPPNPVLLLIAPMFDELALPLPLHDCRCENEPLARGSWGTGSRR